MKSLPALLALLLSLPLAADQLLLLLPRHHDIVPLEAFTEAVPAGDGFVLTGSRRGANYDIFLAADGTVRRTMLMPFAARHFVAGGVIFAVGPNAFLRTTLDGQPLDGAPRALPVDELGAITGVAANDDHVLVAHGTSEYFIEPDGSVVPYDLPGWTGTIVSNGRDFLRISSVAAQTGIALHAGDGAPLYNLTSNGPEPGTLWSSIASDGTTWAISADARVYLFDATLTPLGTSFARNGVITGYRGGGYSDWRGASYHQPATVTLRRPPAYDAHSVTYDEDRAMQFAFGSTSELIASRPPGQPWAGIWIGEGVEAAMMDPALLRPVAGAFPVDREQAKVATNDAGVSLFVWSELIAQPDAAPRAEIRAARVSPQGILLDRDALVLAEVDEALATPYIASNGSGYLVGWSSHDVLFFRAVAATGEVSATAEFPVTYYGGEMSIARSGDEYGVVWLSGYDSFRGLRVAADGSFIAAERHRIDTTIVEKRDIALPRLASAPDGFLLAFQHGLNVESVRLERGLAPIGNPATVISNMFIDRLQRAGDRYLMTTSRAVLWLTPEGDRSTGSLDPFKFSLSVTTSCDDDACTLMWPEDGSIVAASLSHDGVLGERETLLAAPQYIAAKPLLRRDRMFVYQAFDPVNGGLQLFVRLPPPSKKRAVH